MDEFKDKLEKLSAKIAELKQKKAKQDSDKEYLLRRKAELAKKLLVHQLKDHKELEASITELKLSLDTKLKEINSLFESYDKVAIATDEKVESAATIENKADEQQEKNPINNSNLELDEL